MDKKYFEEKKCLNHFYRDLMFMLEDEVSFIIYRNFCLFMDNKVISSSRLIYSYRCIQNLILLKNNYTVHFFLKEKDDL